jgi:hypothetical protein
MLAELVSRSYYEGFTCGALGIAREEECVINLEEVEIN